MFNRYKRYHLQNKKDKNKYVVQCFCNLYKNMDKLEIRTEGPQTRPFFCIVLIVNCKPVS